MLFTQRDATFTDYIYHTNTLPTNPHHILNIISVKALKRCPFNNYIWTFGAIAASLFHVAQFKDIELTVDVFSSVSYASFNTSHVCESAYCMCFISEQMDSVIPQCSACIMGINQLLSLTDYKRPHYLVFDPVFGACLEYFPTCENRNTRRPVIVE